MKNTIKQKEIERKKKGEFVEKDVENEISILEAELREKLGDYYYNKKMYDVTCANLDQFQELLNTNNYDYNVLIEEHGVTVEKIINKHGYEYVIIFTTRDSSDEVDSFEMALLDRELYICSNIPREYYELKRSGGKKNYYNLIIEPKFNEIIMIKNKIKELEGIQQILTENKRRMCT